MNYNSEIEMITKFMDLADANAQNYRAGDTSRCYYTDGMMQGLSYALTSSGHQVEYLTYIAENGCPRPVSLTVDGHEIINDSGIQYNALESYKQSLLPEAQLVEQVQSEPTNKVLVIRPDDMPEQKEMPLDLASLQKEVDGYIEAVYPFEDNVAIIVNEEGKLNGLPFNRALRDKEGLVFDVTAGTMVVVGIGDENFTGLTEEQIQKYDKIFHDPEQFRYVGGRLVVTKLRKDQHTHATDTSIKKAPHNHGFER